MVIKIFVSCNQESYVPTHPLLYPIQTGAALIGRRFSNMLNDCSGINISHKNFSYCELTSQYWAWKNAEADYYGFMHNRRYFSFSERRLPTDKFGNVPMGLIDDQALTDLGYNEENMRSIIGNYDIITVDRLDMKDFIPFPAKRTVYNQYICTPQHNKTDLDMALEILNDKYPEFMADAREYLSSDSGYYFNLFIMSKLYFGKYCAWLFDILDEFDSRQDFSECSVYEQRKTAFIAERLFGIYLTHLKKLHPEIRIKHCQHTLFSSLDVPYPQPIRQDAAVIAAISSDEYAPLLGVMLRSLVDNTNPDRYYDIVVLSNGMSAENRKILSLESGKHNNITLRFVDISYHLTSKKLPTKFHISTASYARFLLQDILRLYDKVLYLDCDIIINADPAIAYDTDITGLLAAAVRDTAVASWYRMPGHLERDNLDNVLNLKNPYDYFNAGVMVLNLKRFRETISTKQLFELACTRNWLWLDQDILNYICAGSVKFLDQSWNVMAHAQANPTKMDERFAPKWISDAYHAARALPRIIHYAGHTVPCYIAKPDLYWYFWEYARRSLFYEPLIRNIAEATKEQKAGSSFRTLLRTLYRIVRVFRKAMRPVVNLLFPIGTRRREKAVQLYSKFGQDFEM